MSPYCTSGMQRNVFKCRRTAPLARKGLRQFLAFLCCSPEALELCSSGSVMSLSVRTEIITLLPFSHCLRDNGPLIVLLCAMDCRFFIIHSLIVSLLKIFLLISRISGLLVSVQRSKECSFKNVRLFPDIFRERDKQRQRELVWARLHGIAQVNPQVLLDLRPPQVFRNSIPTNVLLNPRPPQVFHNPIPTSIFLNSIVFCYL